MNQTDAMEAYAGKRVLITGGLGFMGLNLARALHEANAQLRVLSPPRPIENLGVEQMLGNATFFMGDIRDAGLVADAVAGCELVFHLAGKSGPARSNSLPIEDLEVNARGTLILLEACRRVDPRPKIVFPSSRLVYAAHSHVPVSETARTEPVSVYGIHKLIGERYLTLYQQLYGVRSTILRITNPYGPFQRPEQSDYGVINWFIHQTMKDRVLPIYGDGRQLRDYVHVDDVVRAMLLAGHRSEADGKIFNVGSGHGVSFVDMAELVIKGVGRGALKHVDWPADAAQVETGDFVADVSLISASLGWEATVSLESGIHDVIDRYSKLAPAWL